MTKSAYEAIRTDCADDHKPCGVNGGPAVPEFDLMRGSVTLTFVIPKKMAPT